VSRYWQPTIASLPASTASLIVREVRSSSFTVAARCRRPTAFASILLASA
jgi:hypothetical protein